MHFTEENAGSREDFDSTSSGVLPRLVSKLKESHRDSHARLDAREVEKRDRRGKRNRGARLGARAMEEGEMIRARERRESRSWGNMQSRLLVKASQPQVYT